MKDEFSVQHFGTSRLIAGGLQSFFHPFNNPLPLELGDRSHRNQTNSNFVTATRIFQSCVIIGLGPGLGSGGTSGPGSGIGVGSCGGLGIGRLPASIIVSSSSTDVLWLNVISAGWSCSVFQSTPVVPARCMTCCCLSKHRIRRRSKPAAAFEEKIWQDRT